MRHLANFVLQIQPATPTTPAHVSIALTGVTTMAVGAPLGGTRRQSGDR
jgi:hypothetical protein